MYNPLNCYISSQHLQPLPALIGRVTNIKAKYNESCIRKCATCLYFCATQQVLHQRYFQKKERKAISCGRIASLSSCQNRAVPFCLVSLCSTVATVHCDWTFAILSFMTRKFSRGSSLAAANGLSHGADGRRVPMSLWVFSGGDRAATGQEHKAEGSQHVCSACTGSVHVAV